MSGNDKGSVIVLPIGWPNRMGLFRRPVFRCEDCLSNPLGLYSAAFRSLFNIHYFRSNEIRYSVGGVSGNACQIEAEARPERHQEAL